MSAGATATGAVDVSAPRSRSEANSIAPVLAAAFLDDPVWRSVGPRSRRHRALTNRLSFWGSVRASVRHGARVRIARRAPDRSVAGAAVAFEPGRWPIPDSAFAWELPWALASGPLPLVRGLRTDRAMRERQPEYPHMYLWFIGVAPPLHGTGVGSALLAELHHESDRLAVPTYLETGTEANVALYERHGYRALGEIPAPADSRLWRMERPTRQ